MLSEHYDDVRRWKMGSMHILSLLLSIHLFILFAFLFLFVVSGVVGSCCTLLHTKGLKRSQVYHIQKPIQA